MSHAVKHTFPTVPLQVINIVSLGYKLLLHLFSPASVICFSVAKQYTPFTSLGLKNGIVPLSQYKGSEVLGVPPGINLITSVSLPTFHPSGIIPNSLSTNLPFLKGSKSTNQFLKIACAISSKSALILLFNSIFRSREERMEAMRRWSSYVGYSISTLRNSACFMPVTVVPLSRADRDF